MSVDLSYLTLEEAKESLCQHQYLQVPFSLPTNTIEEAVQAFFRFLQEPEDVKSHIDFNMSEKHRRGDVGLKYRNPDDHIYNDSKEFFHFHPEIFEKYSEFLKENPVVLDFMMKAQPIWKAGYETAYKILEKFEPEFPKTIDKIFGAKHPHVLLRFLNYHWAQSGKYLAKPHFDAGAFTLAIAESEPGLRMGSDPASLRLVEHKEDHAMFFFSSNYQKVMDTQDIKPAWHDVIQLDETKIGKPYARWAVVLFIESFGVEALPRSETRKWYIPESGDQEPESRKIS